MKPVRKYSTQQGRIYCGSLACKGGHKWVPGQWRLNTIDCGAPQQQQQQGA